MTETIVVIEAPGKIKAVRKILGELRFNAKVLATGGALYDIPRDQLGLNPNDLTPTTWIPTSERTIKHLTTHFRSASKIFVMTDADREGELIAAQVGAVLSSSGSSAVLQRVTSSALNADSIKAALAKPRGIDRNICLGVLARRGIDRAIGYLCSNPSAVGQIAGRISSKIVKTISEKPLDTMHLSGTHPDQPSWRMWSRASTVRKPSLQALEQGFREMDPALMNHQRQLHNRKPAPKPLDGADTLLLVAKNLEISLVEAEKLIQTAYERGAISYARTDSRDISRTTKVMLESAMRTLGHRVRVDKGAADAQRTAPGAHEAVHPASPMGNIASSLEGLSQLDKAVALITRRTFAALSPDAQVKTFEIDQGAINDFLKAKGLPPVRAKIWRDVPETAGWLKIEREFLKPVKLAPIPLDIAVLERLVEQDIGRPSTVVGHIDKALSRGWLLENGNLSVKGQTVLAYLTQSYPALLNAHDLDKFFAGVAFDKLADATREGIERMGLDFAQLRSMARDSEVEVQVTHSHEGDDSGLPVYEPVLAEGLDDMAAAI
jgi:DNA topoisomerase IA